MFLCFFAHISKGTPHIYITISYRENPFLNSPKHAQSLHEMFGDVYRPKKQGLLREPPAGFAKAVLSRFTAAFCRALPPGKKFFHLFVIKLK